MTKSILNSEWGVKIIGVSVMFILGAMLVYLIRLFGVV